MKKLIGLIFLGILFFIGGQWLGLLAAPKQVLQTNPGSENAQNGSASPAAKPVVPSSPVVNKPLLKTGPVLAKPPMKPRTPPVVGRGEAKPNSDDSNKQDLGIQKESETKADGNSQGSGDLKDPGSLGTPDDASGSGTNP